MLRLTPEVLETSYEFLRSTSPFRRWKLPHADAVEVTQIIFISEVTVGHTYTLMRTMAHEMIHLYLAISGQEDSGEHGAEFRRLARLVCNDHGFDPKEF